MCVCVSPVLRPSYKKKSRNDLDKCVYHPHRRECLTSYNFVRLVYVKKKIDIPLATLNLNGMGAYIYVMCTDSYGVGLRCCSCLPNYD